MSTSRQEHSTLKAYCLIFSLLTCQTVFADCDPDIRGKWLLDYQHYLDAASKGNPDVRKKLDAIWGGQSFVGMSFDPDTGLGMRSDRNSNSWSSYVFSYRVTESSDGSCTMTTFIDGRDSPSQYGSFRFWATQTGFCLLPLESDRWEDCFVREIQ